MRDALKPSLHSNEEPYNIEFCANLGPAHCNVRTFLMHSAITGGSSQHSAVVLFDLYVA